MHMLHALDVSHAQQTSSTHSIALPSNESKPEPILLHYEYYPVLPSIAQTVLWLGANELYRLCNL